jgi:hypothetical protein
VPEFAAPDEDDVTRKFPALLKRFRGLAPAEPREMTT